MQYVAFVALTPVAAAIMVLVAAFAWRRRATPPAPALLVLAVCTLGWLVSNALELLSPSASGTLGWARITYVFVAVTPLAWLIFALQYVGHREWLEPERLALLAIGPGVTSVVALTSGTHDLLWAEYRFALNRGLFDLYVLEYGPWFWVNVLFAYGCVLLGATLIVSHYVEVSRPYRRQMRWVVVGAVSVVVVNAVYVFRLIPGWRKDYSPLALAFAGLLFAASIFRDKLLDLRPIGRNQLVESMRDAVIVVDDQHRIVDANPAACSLIGGSEGEVIGEPVSDCLPLAGPILTSSRPGPEVREEVSIERDGEERDYELRVSEVTDHHREPRGRLIVLHDVTEHREAMRQLHQQERLAAIGQLASGIAHDFNNLLGSIMLNAQLVQHKVDDLSYEAEQSLKVIVQESRYGADLVAQILDFSRSGMTESTPLDLSCFVRDVAGVVRRTIREDIELMVETPLRPCIVEADPTRMQQVLLNLVTNARDAMPSGGELRITVEGPPWAPGAGRKGHRIPPVGWACLAVSDTGTGMDEQVCEHLFEPFFTTKEPDKGTGLGLAQVYGIVKQHGGRIDVESEVGEGTTFHIHLPLHDAEPPAREGQETEPEPRGRGELILLVEDEENLREASREALTSLGYRVLAAANAREALDRLDGHRIDLVITDLVMPEMGGGDLLRELADRCPEVPVLAVTGYAAPDEAYRLTDLGFSDVLRKPFDAPALAQAVHRNLCRDVL